MPKRKRQGYSNEDTTKEDDLAIHKYERLLTANKKSKLLKHEMEQDGLSYLFDAVENPYGIHEVLIAEDKQEHKRKHLENDYFSDSDEDAAAYLPTNSKAKSRAVAGRKALASTHASNTQATTRETEESDAENSSGSDDESDQEESSEESTGGEESSGDENSRASATDGEDDENTSAADNRKKTVHFKNLKEDIYGRLRDKKGNVVPTSSVYVPPAKRSEISGVLTTKLKGLFNRVSESNLEPITKQIQGLFSQHSRGEACECICQVLMDSCIRVAQVPERLVQEQCLLLVLLHRNSGSSIGASFLQAAVEKFDTLLGINETYGEGKEMDNLLCVLCNLYNFNMIQSKLIFDMLQKFVTSFSERDMELILLILKNAGATLRKDNPLGLKSFVHDVQSKAVNTDAENSRVKFLLDTIVNIKNNNMRKIPGYNPEHLEHLKKLLRNYSKSSSNGANPELNVSLDDLLKAKTKGKWWLVGSAWSGQVDNTANIEERKSQVQPATSFSAELLALAAKQKMNTDIRRNIFCSIMSSEDINDAFEKCLHLNLTTVQEREIIAILIHLCMNEKLFNPFYALLVQKFCSYHRRFLMTFQFHMWDQFKDIANMKSVSRQNLAKLLHHLIASKKLSLSVLKTLNFVQLDEKTSMFLQELLTGLLLSYDLDDLKEIFMKLSANNKLRHVREGLVLFLRQRFSTNKLASYFQDKKILAKFSKRMENVLSLPGFDD